MLLQYISIHFLGTYIYVYIQLSLFVTFWRGFLLCIRYTHNTTHAKNHKIFSLSIALLTLVQYLPCPSSSADAVALSCRVVSMAASRFLARCLVAISVLYVHVWALRLPPSTCRWTTTSKTTNYGWIECKDSWADVDPFIWWLEPFTLEIARLRMLQETTCTAFFVHCIIIWITFLCTVWNVPRNISIYSFQ